MKRIKLKLIITAFFIFVSFASSAAETMDLDSFLESALEHNYELVQSRAAVEKAEGQKSEMRGNFFPNLSAGYTANYIDRDQEISMSMPLATPAGDIVYEDVSIEMGKKENRSADVTASMPLFTFGKIRGGYNIASKSLEIERSRYRARRDRVISDVKKSFYRVLLAEEIVSAAQRQVSLMEENLDMTRRLYSSGKASNLDISRVKVHLSRAESGLIEAQANLKIARESLFTLCRIKRGDDIEIKGELEEKEFNYELENLVDKALKNREEL
ncbi:MAG: TolC family protein, partial [Elusimicrobiota bacterium]|nr:TolC family protein [Elusimicrobiota bacterium]